jgi:CBS domain-containing protein
MKVKDIMTTDTKACGPDTNLAAATEIMWSGDCGILPVVDEGDHVVGVITDRDICIAVGTRGWLASDISVKDAISGNVFACLPDTDIRDALETMRVKKVRRLVAVNSDGKIAGILSLDDVAAAAQSGAGGRRSDLSLDDVALTLKAICGRPLAQTELTDRPAAATG